MRILLLSAYDAVSHRYWHQGLVKALSEHEWQVLTLPPRHFTWRVRGNSLSWAYNERDRLEQPFDLILATSMVDLTGLRGLVPSLAGVPTLVYFHENQFAYPESAHAFKSVEPKILNLYNALAADRVLFNTDFNRQTLLEGAASLLRKLPDQVPSGLVERIDAHSAVVPVPMPDAVFQPATPISGPLQLVWNHRWEYDKGPDLLLHGIEHLIEAGTEFTLHVVGQQFRHSPAVFEQIRQRLSQHGRLGNWGHIDSLDAYRRLLQQADAVISTALHDFQGIAVLEAVASGCTPVVPDRLAYRALFAEPFRYKGENEARTLAQQIQQLAQIKASGAALPCPDVRHLSWSSQARHYRAELEHTLR